MIEIIDTMSSMNWEQVWTVLATIAAIIGGIGTVLERASKKDWKGAFEALNDLMDPFKPQTEEQNKVISKIAPETFTMSDEEYDRMCNELIASGAQFNERGMRHVVSYNESVGHVEYAIMVEDHDGNPSTQCKHVFVSYGTPVVMNQTEVFKRAVERHANISAVSN